MTTVLNQESYDKTIQLKIGDVWTVKDHRGFTVAEINEAGDIKRKGRDVKL